jgi:hypothetical protein
LFDAAIMCQYTAAPTGALDLSALEVSTPVSGADATRLRAVLQSAPAWPTGTNCAVPSPENPLIRVMLYGASRPVGTVTVYLSGCHMIQGSQGQANADEAVQGEVRRLMGTGGAVAAGPIAGIWHVHTYYLSVTPDGNGVFTWPVGIPCPTGVEQGPRCDTVRNSGEIIDGGYATLTVTQQAGDSATGIISSSTDPATLPDGQVALRVAPNDLLYISTTTAPTSRAFDYLCGQQAASLPTAQQVAEHINCGA